MALRSYSTLDILLYSIIIITQDLSGVVYVQLAYLSIGDWRDISIAHVIIIIKSEVSTFLIVFIFFRGCVPDMFVTSYSVTYCIYIPGIREFVFISIVQFVMSANIRIRFGLQIVFVSFYITPSHYHHCGNFIWRHWTYKMPIRYNLSSVWVFRAYSLSYPLYKMWGCVSSIYPFPSWWLR